MQQKLKSYYWQAINSQGEKVVGKEKALHPQLLKFVLQKQALSQIIIKRDYPLFTIKQKIKAEDIRLFTRQIATLLRSGISLIQALIMTSNSNHKNEMKQLIIHIKQHIEQGHSVAQAFAKFSIYFDKLYTHLILVGEKTGTMDAMFERLAIHQEKTATLKAKIKKALFYPAIVILVAMIVTIALLIFIVPQFAALFSSFGAKLPAPTQFLIELADSLNRYGIWLLTLLSALIFIAHKKIKSSIKWSASIDKQLLKLPLLGNILQKTIIAQITRTLATVFAAGLPLIDALDTIANSTGNHVYNKAVMTIKQNILQGLTLHQAIAKTGIFPELVLQLVSIGEISGTMESMLNKIANIYTEDVDSNLDNLSNLLEPFIIIVLGIIIGALVIAMYLPIFKLGSVI